MREGKTKGGMSPAVKKLDTIPTRPKGPPPTQQPKRINNVQKQTDCKPSS